MCFISPFNADLILFETISRLAMKNTLENQTSASQEENKSFTPEKKSYQKYFSLDSNSTVNVENDYLIIFNNDTFLREIWPSG